MSDNELKPCPFCGSTNHPYHKEGCFIINCLYASEEAYKERPLEDALRTRAELAENRVAQLETAYKLAHLTGEALLHAARLLSPTLHDLRAQLDAANERIRQLEAMLEKADEYFVELGDVSGYEFDQECIDCGAGKKYNRDFSEWHVAHNQGCEVAKLKADLEAWRKLRGAK